jgi:hypothetical protein
MVVEAKERIGRSPDKGETSRRRAQSGRLAVAMRPPWALAGTGAVRGAMDMHMSLLVEVACSDDAAGGRANGWDVPIAIRKSKAYSMGAKEPWQNFMFGSGK